MGIGEWKAPALGLIEAKLGKSSVSKSSCFKLFAEGRNTHILFDRPAMDRPV